MFSKEYYAKKFGNGLAPQLVKLKQMQLNADIEGLEARKLELTNILERQWWDRLDLLREKEQINLLLLSPVIGILLTIKNADLDEAVNAFNVAKGQLIGVEFKTAQTMLESRHDYQADYQVKIQKVGCQKKYSLPKAYQIQLDNYKKELQARRNELIVILRKQWWGGFKLQEEKEEIESLLQSMGVSFDYEDTGLDLLVDTNVNTVDKVDDFSTPTIHAPESKNTPVVTIVETNNVPTIKENNGDLDNKPDNKDESIHDNFVPKQSQSDQTHVYLQTDDLNAANNNPPIIPPQTSFLLSVKRSHVRLCLAGISVGAIAYWFYAKFKQEDENAEDTCLESGIENKEECLQEIV